MGTPDFAVTILKKLVDEGLDIVGVITAPDKPAGRGQKIRKSAVKVYAEEANLNILQPTNLKDEDFIQELTELKVDLQVVVAFRMLPEMVWNMPPLGTINLHASLLPQYRGAAPINWAIMNGEKETGVTTFYIEQEIDTGAVIEQEKVMITPEDTAGSLHDKLMHLGAKLTYQSVIKIIEGTAPRKIQTQLFENESDLKGAPKIFKPDCQVSFDHDRSSVINKIKGLSPYPTAWIKIQELTSDKTKTCKVFDVVASDRKLETNSIEVFEHRLFFGTKNGSIEILELQLEGKKRMPLKDLFNGFNFSDWKLIE
jgi:methionyl-tRNA formyltransferase